MKCTSTSTSTSTSQSVTHQKDRLPHRALDYNLWASIASNLNVRCLGCLASVEMWFSETTNYDWSVVDEGARVALHKHFIDKPYTRGWVPRRPGERWLNLLHEFNQLLSKTRFCRNRSKSDVIITGFATEDDTAQCEDNRFRAAISKVPMRAGRHYAEFTHHSGGWPGTEMDEDGLGEMAGTGMGVVGTGFDNEQYIIRYSPERPEPRVVHVLAASGSKHGWMFQTCEDGGDVLVGALGHNLNRMKDMGWGSIMATAESACLIWPGIPGGSEFGDCGGRRLVQDAVVGLLLDVDKGTLAVYLNGTRCGIMMQRGGLFKNTEGGVPADMEPPLRWAVDVGFGSAISIESKPPPVVTEHDRADDERKAKESKPTWNTRGEYPRTQSKNKN